MSKHQARETAQKVVAENAAVEAETKQGPSQEPEAGGPNPTASPAKIMLEVMAVSEQGFWRCGRKFTRKPVKLDLDQLTQNELQRFQAEHKAKNLVCKLVEARA